MSTYYNYYICKRENNTITPIMFNEKGEKLDIYYHQSKNSSLVDKEMREIDIKELNSKYFDDDYSYYILDCKDMSYKDMCFSGYFLLEDVNNYLVKHDITEDELKYNMLAPEVYASLNEEEKTKYMYYMFEKGYEDYAFENNMIMNFIDKHEYDYELDNLYIICEVG